MTSGIRYFKEQLFEPTEEQSQMLESLYNLIEDGKKTGLISPTVIKNLETAYSALVKKCCRIVEVKATKKGDVWQSEVV